MKILIKNGRVLDPKNNIDDYLDILIENKKISKIAKNIKEFQIKKLMLMKCG